MNVRPLDLLDLPLLRRYGDKATSLDSARLLTRGNPLGAAGLLSHLNPERHLYTAVGQEETTSLLGGILHNRDELFARLLYLAPQANLTHPGLPALIEHLCAQAGEWGAFHVLAEVNETDPAFSALRQAGFSVYAWQRIWDVSSLPQVVPTQAWLRAKPQSLPALQSLHAQIVPPLLHPIEPAPRKTGGFTCADGFRCYVQVSSGMYGTLLTPLIHPEVEGVGAKILSLLRNLPKKPVYLRVRSYQAWLEPALEDLGATAGQRQAVMVKHLARLAREEQTVRAAHPASAIPASRFSKFDTKK